jgi:predicted adenylyl cyclase CyaB
MMNRNVEIKARVTHADDMRTMLQALTDTPCETLHQEDTFFRVGSGRLKLRMILGDDAELIYYERPDVSGAKESRYLRCKVPNPADMRQALSAALGVEGTVKKERLLYMVGQSRLHLDTVEGLGTFLEIEVVLTEGQTVEEGHRIAAELTDRLKIHTADLVPCAYVDLLD